MMPAGAAAVACAGETLWLLPELAVYWPARATLLVADVHLGKAAAFRAWGQPVPAGTTRATLARLGRALSLTGASRLIVLGDLVHARESASALGAPALAEWRARHAGVACVLVRGNHDRAAGPLSAWPDLAVQTEPWRLGPFALCHEPMQVEGAYALAGHLHPVRILHGPGRDSARLPCFDFGPGLGLLPAFGDFTGGHPLPRRAGHAQFVAADGRVLRVP
ncbi:ligase-associated DNA damage response endonuclease PdeM [Verticiella sediminum]|uniref:Ligase-associated DNA damage response endonuclease PdeM n=1 Tax=Verticiella sediminum TaxID=1247510 RepID=A0A556AS76_9BURK|nr:ligase-associated DNA damage response endonuclease PdeM [Verticiella sediminum]TSH95787.1 ligase-associated DNA damage response endonuclease PdeM [Verticiella sediminum]